MIFGRTSFYHSFIQYPHSTVAFAKLLYISQLKSLLIILKLLCDSESGTMTMFIFFFLLFSLLALLVHLIKHFSTSHSPPTYPLIGCLISFYKNRYRLLDWYTDLLVKSPTQTIIIKRFGATRTIVTANPNNVQYMLKTNFNNFPKGKPFTQLLGDLLGRGIFNTDGELWRTQRKIASHGFTTKLLREFLIKILEKQVQTMLIPILESAMNSSEAIDLQELLRRFTFDTVCKLSLGSDRTDGCLDMNLTGSSLERAFDVAAEISAKRAAAPLFVIWKMKRALGIGSERNLKEAIGHVHELVGKIIQEKKKKNLQEEKEEEDLLSRLISAGYDEEMTRDMVISFIMAGRDTTSAAMTWLFWLLSRHPDVEKDVAKEINKITNIKSGDDHERLFSIGFEGLKEMRLLQASLCESMRLYPPVAWDSKHAVVHDMLPDGTKLKPGDRVTYFPYGMGRMEGLWGKDQMEFNPDRWFVESGRNREGEMRNVSPYKFPVFQAGPRVCLGKEMAFIQMKYVVASILKRFELKPINTETPIFVPLLTAHMAGGFKVRVMERRS